MNVTTIIAGMAGMVLSQAVSLGQAEKAGFSLQLVEINSVQIVGQGVSRATVSPGDLLVAKIYIRDWSSKGDRLGAYQAELLPGGFESGKAGTIRPVAYAETTLSGNANPRNAFIDSTDPGFVHHGLQVFPAVPSNSVDPSYRWMSIVVPNEGPISRQNGTKYYCGTLNLVVSDDAEGTFTIDFKNGNDFCTLLTPNSEMIDGYELEPLVLDVRPKGSSGETRCWISRTTPTSGSIDARATSSPNAKGWSQFELRMSCDASSLDRSAFKVTDDTGNPPSIKRVKASGKTITLELSRPIAANTWTSITHKESGTEARFGRIQGDVNNDGFLDAADLSGLISVWDQEKGVSTDSGDIDANGTTDAQDLIRVLSLIDDEMGA